MKSTLSRSPVRLFLMLACAALVAPQPGAATLPNFTFTGSLNTARSSHAATLLPDGRVLVTGGFFPVNSPIRSAELYDPATGIWSLTGELITARAQHTATLLPSGKVLVVGGADAGLQGLTSAELYDPSTGDWTATGSLQQKRKSQTATLLPDGKVLLAGGVVNFSAGLSSAELYDPSSGTWSLTGELNTGRYLHTATILPDGNVLVAGGQSDPFFTGILDSTEIYQTSTGIWSFADHLIHARKQHACVLLADGTPLVIGGSGPGASELRSGEVYHLVTEKWTRAGQLSRRGRINPTATLLADGRVLVAGGNTILNHQFNRADLYESVSGMWNATARLNEARTLHSATLLTDGSVLIAGGTSQGIQLNSAEIFHYALSP